MDIRNKKWTDEEFLRERKEVLAQWPTGKQVDLAEAIEFVCSAFDIPFTPSLEYMKYSDHPKMWRW